MSSTNEMPLVPAGSTVMLGGFGLCGTPLTLIKALSAQKQATRLRVVANTAGTNVLGLVQLLRERQVESVVTSHLGDNKFLEEEFLAGRVGLELVTQGTLAESIRCGGAGVPYFATRVGVGIETEKGGFPVKYAEKGVVERRAEPKPTFTCPKTGEKLLLEASRTGDFGLIKAWRADRSGNLVFNKSAMNLNPDIGRACRCVVAEVDEIVEDGELDPNFIHLPGIFVHHVVLSSHKKVIEKMTNSNVIARSLASPSQNDSPRFRIARRAAAELRKGEVVNLGLGIPVAVAFFLDPKLRVTLHTENGVLGLEGYPMPGREDPDLINPSKETVSVSANASFFSSSDSFAMIRGGHIDTTMLGALQVDQHGNIANWTVPDRFMRGPGGAIDLTFSCPRVIALMTHTWKGQPKIVERCTLPLTGVACLSKIITDRAVFEVLPQRGLLLTDIAEGTSVEELRAITGCGFAVAEKLNKFN